ncbi:uncharacterized protein METZ01_LOCUS117015 [marine metagenome]|uniref:Uncharacterized protein n=1 Tax=marine metagenome TaxID=408172 RepID=A0A381XI64_9ZZZZ
MPHQLLSTYAFVVGLQFLKMMETVSQKNKTSVRLPPAGGVLCFIGLIDFLALYPEFGVYIITNPN